MTDNAVLSSDRPSTDPAEDLFGHAPFAKTLAKAIKQYRQSDGIVLALYGPWGSGKSTVLAYVQHELAIGPENDCPVIVSFNPWWFSGQEHLAKAFLGQLQAVLPEKHKGFEKIGNLLADFSESIGGAADLAGKSLGIPFFGKFFETGAKRLAAKPKDVPALKKALSALLLKQRKRVVVVIDDIDRLTPDEVRQLFTVIKGLADFPYVTYLLAFDREVAATAISEQTGLPGERYLEKIIQVPFELPRPDRTALRKALFKRLDIILESTPKGRFDNNHWNNIFYSGIDPLIKVPRDVVRLANALSVTYPAVVGEVNPVDFIAIESLRVFLPAVYDSIRSAPEKFSGYVRLGGYDEAETKRGDQAFHQGWLVNVPESLQNSTKDMLERLFPRLEAVWGNTYYGRESGGDWRRQLRICSPEIFTAYFRLSLPNDAVSRAEIDALLATTHSSVFFAESLMTAATVIGTSDVSKASTLLDRFMDHATEMDAEHVKPVINALLDVGDNFLSPAAKNSGIFGFGNEFRVERIIYHLLIKIIPVQRADLLREALVQGNALECSRGLINLLAQEAEKATNGQDESLLSEAEVEALKVVWCVRVKQLSTIAEFIDNPSVAWLVNTWRKWGAGAGADAITWWQIAASRDEGLVKLITAVATESRSQSGSDLSWRSHLRVDPRILEPYGDVQVIAQRVRALIGENAVADPYLAAANQFVLACERMKAGKDPDAIGIFEEDI